MDKTINSASFSQKKWKKPLVIMFGTLLLFNIIVSIILNQRSRFLPLKKALVSPSPKASGISLSKTEENQVLFTGRVFNKDPKYAGCPDSVFYYGDDCGEGSCHGSSNYRVSWRQAGEWVTIWNNECWPPAGEINAKPQFSFSGSLERSPLGSPEGKNIEIRVKMQDQVKLVGWYFRVSDSKGNIYTFPDGTSEQIGSFAKPGSEQIIKLNVYCQGDYKFNYLLVWADSIR